MIRCFKFSFAWISFYLLYMIDIMWFCLVNMVLMACQWHLYGLKKLDENARYYTMKINFLSRDYLEILIPPLDSADDYKNVDIKIVL